MPLTTPTILLGFLLPWAWGISSWLLQQSAAAASYLGQGVSLTAAPPDRERGVAPLGPPAPAQPLILGINECVLYAWCLDFLSLVLTRWCLTRDASWGHQSIIAVIAIIIAIIINHCSDYFLPSFIVSGLLFFKGKVPRAELIFMSSNFIFLHQSTAQRVSL